MMRGDTDTEDNYYIKRPLGASVRSHGRKYRKFEFLLHEKLKHLISKLDSMVGYEPMINRVVLVITID